MADKKISQLTGASTPLAGSEVLPIVQSGSTVKVSVDDLTAGKSVSATSFVPTGTTVPANGMFLSSANSVGFATNTTEHWVVNASGNFNPVGSKGIGTSLAPVNGVVATTLQSTVATGTAPLTVASTTEVANLRSANATSADTANAVKSNATTGVLQITGPAASSTRVMTTPNASFTVARTDAAQTFTGAQSFSDTVDATKLIPTGGTASGNGMYLPAANSIGITTGGANAIRINSSQQTGFGNTAPGFRVHATQTSDGAATTVACLENGGTLASTEARMLFVQGGNTTRGAYIGGLNESASGQPASLVFGTSAAYAAPTERMKITSAGNVSITNGNLAFATSGKGITDTNGNESMLFTATASAVNELTVANAATGNNPAISATGDDTNIGINLTPKGTGSLRLTAGNFGVNVTPSAWDSGFEVIENTGGSFYSGSANGISLGQNIYYGGGAFKYKTTNLASRLLFDAGAFKFSTAPSGTGGTNVTLTEVVRISNVGNVSIGGTATRGTTVGTAALNIFNGTAPAGTLTNGISIYSSSGEAYVMDAAGNATLFSPHDSETNEWIFKSKHTPTGKVLRIDVEKLLRFVNDHFGLDAVKEFVEE